MADNRWFGRRVKDIRLERGMTQSQLSSMIPMNQSNYAKIEKGTQEPSIDQLVMICSALRVSPAEVLGFSELHQNSQELMDEQQYIEDTIMGFYAAFPELRADIEEEKFLEEPPMETPDNYLEILALEGLPPPVFPPCDDHEPNPALFYPDVLAVKDYEDCIFEDFIKATGIPRIKPKVRVVDDDDEEDLYSSGEVTPFWY